MHKQQIPDLVGTKECLNTKRNLSSNSHLSKVTTKCVIYLGNKIPKHKKPTFLQDTQYVRTQIKDTKYICHQSSTNVSISYEEFERLEPLKCFSHASIYLVLSVICLKFSFYCIYLSIVQKFELKFID